MYRQTARGETNAVGRAGGGRERERAEGEDEKGGLALGTLWHNGNHVIDVRKVKPIGRGLLADELLIYFVCVGKSPCSLVCAIDETKTSGGGLRTLERGTTADHPGVPV